MRTRERIEAIEHSKLLGREQIALFLQDSLKDFWCAVIQLVHHGANGKPSYP